MEGRAGKACKHARTARGHAREGAAERLYATAEQNAGPVLMVMLGLLLLVAVSWGQACQAAYQRGISEATASAKVEADAQAYDRGYAAAVYEYQEGAPSWARE